MAHLNHLSGLKRRFDHIKVMTDAGHEDYEPTMVLYREGAMGRSFMVPLNCMWKYMEPKANKDMVAWDVQEYNDLVQTTAFKRKVSIGADHQQAVEDAAGCVFAYEANKRTGILLCTAFSLFKACKVLDITASQQSLVQLLLFIQDGLDDLQKMPPAEPEDKIEEGEVVITIDGQKHHMPLETTLTDLAREGME